jgi:Tfp pilus assembly protein PilP
MKQHKLSYNIINSLLFIISSCKSRNNIELQGYLRLVRRQKSTSVTQKQVQVSVNSTGYCSSIYRHMTQPVRNYSHDLYIYYYLIEKPMRTE